MQGDSLAPFYYSILNAEAREENNKMSSLYSPCFHLDFLDDMNMAGEESKVLGMFYNAAEKAKKMGRRAQRREVGCLCKV